MTPQTKSIIAHLTIFGWVIALILNNQQKDEMTSFYLRQTLGLYITGMIFSWIPVLGWLLGILVFAFWLLSLVAAAQNRYTLIPFAGGFFQDIFRGLS